MLTLLFPGQGSQEVGMGRDVFEASRAARAVYETADDALGFALSRLCFEGPEEDLRRTEIQQPAILTTSVALLRALEEQGPVEAAFVAGHSLGEYSALVASGSLSFDDAVRLVHARGRFMQEAVPEGHGAMAAVMGCSAEQVAQACAEVAQETGRVVAPANFNSTAQTVIAGEAPAVELACARARQAGAKRAVPLAVSAPFHCALMEPAAGKLSLELASVRFADPAPPVVTNVEASPNADGSRVAELLRRQVTAPVRFVDMVHTLIGEGVSRFLEIGPGRVLTGLVKRIDRKLQCQNLSLSKELSEAASFAVGN
ncbi:MAG: ACP S-malonyltransferase [Myxococcota bacterium]|nr:ACP S-malonyltransferase [Myxococcota bacterium]